MQDKFCSFINLSDYGILSVSGKDSGKFLQGQLTCDVFSIKAHQSCLAAHCNAQGRVVSLFRLFSFQDIHYLMMPRQLLPIAETALKKYAIFYKTEIFDASNSSLGIIGLFQKNRSALDTLPPSIQAIFVDANRQILIGEKKAILNFKRDKSFCNNTWQLLDIKASIPTLYPETSAQFLPHELGLHKTNALSFEKGCYTGQEIIARMHYRGKIKKDLYKAKTNTLTTLKPGSDIYYQKGQDVKVGGIVVSSCNEEMAQIALIIADKDIAKNNTMFFDKEQRITINLHEQG